MFLTAREAAARLGIKLDTLYAYVSRGRLRSVAVPGTRQRRYRADEVEALREAATLPARAAETAGLTPVIASSICLIEEGRLHYRGQDAIGLAALADTDLPALDLSRSGVVRTGRVILRELVAAVAGSTASSDPADRQLAAGWGLPDAADLLRRCLVLLADHELNASTYVARCVASTGATPYAVVIAALAALSGRRHGGASARAEALLRDIAREGEPLTVMAARLARGEELPGFGHFLYPSGDPRATAILDAIRKQAPDAAPAIDAAVAAGTRLSGHPPNVDFALAVATTTLGLPADAALGLFVVGRTVGWLAHALEQYDHAALIRPRARYVGPRPTPAQGSARSEPRR